MEDMGYGKMRSSASHACIRCLVIAVMAVICVFAMRSDAFASSWPTFRGNDENNAVVSYRTPTAQNATELAWVNKFGEMDPSDMGVWDDMPNPPIIVDGDLVITVNTSIMKLDPDTGEVKRDPDSGEEIKGTLEKSTNYATITLTYDEENNLIYCPLATGIIQAVDADTLETEWVFSATQSKWGLKPETSAGEPSGAAHQTQSPIVCSDGIVYTGLWGGSPANYDYFIAVAAVDKVIDGTEYKAGDLIWKYKSKGGFYWSGGIVIGDAVIVGGQDGIASETNPENSNIYSFNRLTGEVITSTELEGSGDICSTVVWDKEGTERIYWTSKGGKLYSAAVNEETGAVSNIKAIDLDGSKSSVVSTPVVYNRRVYLGYAPTEGAYGYFAAYDAWNLGPLFRAELRGFPKGSILLSNAYEAETGWLYAYTSYYEPPGGLQVIKFNPDATDGSNASQVVVEDLFLANGHSQYCACSVIADERGYLYYKNDSASVFAVKPCEPLELPKISGLKLTPSGTSKVTVKFTEESKATEYRLLYRLNNTGTFTTVNLDECQYEIPVKNSTLVTVRVRAEYSDVAKKVYGDYAEASVYVAKSTVKKLTGAKKAFTVKYDKHANATGYHVQYSLKKSMKSAKTKTVKKASTLSLKVTKLKARKTYYVRVRSYKTVGKKTYYGTWSKVSKVKTK